MPPTHRQLLPKRSNPDHESGIGRCDRSGWLLETAARSRLLAEVLPGFGDLPIRCLPDLTPRCVGRPAFINPKRRVWREGGFAPRRLGQIVSRGRRRWLVRVILDRDRQTRERRYHNRTIRRHCAPRPGIPHKDAPRARLSHLSRSCRCGGRFVR